MMQCISGALVKAWESYLDEQKDALHSEQAQKKNDVQSQTIVISRQAHPHQLHLHTTFNQQDSMASTYFWH